MTRLRYAGCSTWSANSAPSGAASRCCEVSWTVRDLAAARYAAVGVPDGDGRFALFLTAGVDTETWDRIGSLPRTHGLLGALLKEPEVIRADPRFRYYPHAHPDMRSFLGGSQPRNTSS